MRKLIILSGVEGSGKQTLASKIIADYPMKNYSYHSADQHFTSGTGENTRYNFNPKGLKRAHAQCMYTAIKSCEAGNGLVIIGNTNTTAEEISPYVLLGAAFGYSVELITIMCHDMDDVQAACARGKHKVPFQSVLQMHQRLLKREIPRHWCKENDVTILSREVEF